MKRTKPFPFHKHLYGLWLFLTSCCSYYEGPKSDHFDGTCFYDPTLNQSNSFVDLLKWKLQSPKSKWPRSVELTSTDIPPERVYGDELRVTSVGHATFLIQTRGINLLTDPIWSEYASPIPGFGPKRVIAPGIAFEDLPPIDVVWVSHNHYDHLDVKTIDRLWKEHHPKILTPLGNDTIIQSHSKDIEVLTFDWGESYEVSSEMTLHISPSQHWSSRSLFDRNKALWAAITLETPSGNVYFIGDSGYGEGRYVKEEQKRFQKYRLAIMPMGAYEPRWFMKYAHMNPEEFVQAHLDLHAGVSIPSHYDVFDLADDGYGEAKKTLGIVKKHLLTQGNIVTLEVGKGIFIPQEKDLERIDLFD